MSAFRTSEIGADHLSLNQRSANPTVWHKAVALGAEVRAVLRGAFQAALVFPGEDFFVMSAE